MKTFLFSLVVLTSSGCVIPPSNPAPAQSTPMAQTQSNGQAAQPAQAEPSPNPPPAMMVGTVDVGIRGCTKMACSPDNPCCNNCGTQLAIIPEGGEYAGKRIVLEGHQCQANECGQMLECNMSHGERVELPIESVNCSYEGAECTGVMGVQTTQVATAQSAAPTSDGVTSLYGKIRANAQCTMIGCPADNQCCNACTLDVSVTPMSGPFAEKEIVLSGHGCVADGCGRVSNCSLSNDSMMNLPNVKVSCQEGGACFGELNPLPIQVTN